MKKIFTLLMLISLISIISSCTSSTKTITLKYLDSEEQVQANTGSEYIFEEKNIEGYVFVGWYDKNDQIVEKIKVTEDATFTAKFIEYGTVWSITYELNGGKFNYDAPITYKTGTKLIIGTPAGEGNMVFLGWYLNGEYIDNIPANSYGDIVLEAKWDDKNTYYNISYNFDDEVEMPETYVTKYIEGLEYDLPVPKKFGYFFRGWYTEETYENRVKSITTETKTDLTLYPQWVKKTRSNTYVSFLGDSITTYQDTIPQDFPTYYPAGDVNSVDKTWWKITLELSGTNLLANNSYSGSFVSQGSMYGASTKRLELLSKNGMDPDAVVIYMGTNDLTHGITLSKFTTMYKEMIENIKKMYDDVDIFVLTMPSNKYAISFNEPREKMNKAITDIATEYGLFLIDLVELINFDNAYDCMYAGAHPNALGMEIIGKEVSKHISREYKRYWLGEE